MACELESDLQYTVDWGRKWLVDFNTGKTQLVLFDRPNKTGPIDMKMDEFVFVEKSSFKMLGLTFSSKLDWGYYIIISIAKCISEKIRALISLWSFFLMRLLCIFINLPYAHAWHTIVTSGLVPLVTPWNC